MDAKSLKLLRNLIREGVMRADSTHSVVPVVRRKTRKRRR